MNPQYTLKVLALRAGLLTTTVILLVAGHDDIALGVLLSLLAFVVLF